MSFSEDQVVIITGASSGIGQGTAVKFVEKGVTKLCITGRNMEGLRQTEEMCLAANKDVKVLIVQGDIGTAETCQKIVSDTIAEFNRIDVLINNAGFSMFGSVSTQPIEQFQQIMDVNVIAAMRLTKLALPHLRATKGNIVNNSSILAISAQDLNAYYCMSKAALDMFTKCLAIEEGVHGIRANNVNPGLIETSIGEKAGLPKEQADLFKEKVKSVEPLGRNGAPEDVANLITFLASNEAAFISGSSVVVDGALTSRCIVVTK